MYTDLILGSELNSSVCGINTTHVQYTLQSPSDGKKYPFNLTVADNQTNHTCIITITSNPSYCQKYTKVIMIETKGSYRIILCTLTFFYCNNYYVIYCCYLFTETFILNVTITPDDKSSDVVQLGDTVVYNCWSFINTVVDPSVQINIEWKNYNGKTIKEGNESPLTFQITDFNSSQTGNYSCTSWLGNTTNTTTIKQDTILIIYKG